MVYLDLNPVRAGLVSRPQDYPWSSYAHYAGIRSDRRVTPHALVWGLGNTPFDRESRYRELVQSGVTERQRMVLGQAVTNGWVVGDSEFVAGLQQQVQRRLTRSSPGRPPKQERAD
jgi:putative transposase